ncbi:MAG: energy-coupling factor transporter transmembrane component T family protein [Candidatus Zixiibacteriota bacterium]
MVRWNIKNIHLGQYINKDSVIHKLDPRVKLFSLIFFSIYLIIYDSLETHIYGLFIILLVTILSKISIFRILRLLKNILFFIIFILLLHSLFSKGDNSIEFWIFDFSLKGFFHGIVFALRLILMVWAASLFGFTTRPVDITDSMEQSLSFLSRYKLAIRDFSMIMLLAMRFIPSVSRDADRIRLAQKARGHSMKKGNKITGLIPLVIPLFAISFKKADTIALALELKGYNSFSVRTFYKKWAFNHRDLFFLLFFILILLIPFAFLTYISYT